MILDSHVHAWGPPSQNRPWLYEESVEHISSLAVGPVYTADQLVTHLSKNGVDQAVLVTYPIYEWTDNSYTVEAVKNHPSLYGIVLVDPLKNDASDNLRKLMSVNGVLGFRLAVESPYDQMWRVGKFSSSADWLRTAIENEDFWQAALDTESTVQLLTHYNQFDQVLELVNRYPNLNYILDHVGRITPDVEHHAECFRQLEELSEHEGVGIKISEVPHLSNEDFPFADMHDHVRWLLDKFGRKRVIWGSDHPNGSQNFVYQETLNWMREFATISGNDMSWIKGRAFDDLIKY